MVNSVHTLGDLIRVLSEVILTGGLLARRFITGHFCLPINSGSLPQNSGQKG